MSRYYQGYYTLRNPDKYVGNKNKIRYMSAWEYRAHYFFDTNVNILAWTSEPKVIQYIKPTDNKVHFYLPDYWIRIKGKDGKIREEIVEVKPLRQTRPPKKTKTKKQSQYIFESIEYAINQAKWRAAKSFCDKYNMKFRIITEKDLKL